MSACLYALTSDSHTHQTPGECSGGLMLCKISPCTLNQNGAWRFHVLINLMKIVSSLQVSFCNVSKYLWPIFRGHTGFLFGFGLVVVLLAKVKPSGVCLAALTINGHLSH